MGPNPASALSEEHRIAGGPEAGQYRGLNRALTSSIGFWGIVYCGCIGEPRGMMP